MNLNTLGSAWSEGQVTSLLSLGLSRTDLCDDTLLEGLNDEQRATYLERLLDDLNQPILNDAPGPFDLARFAEWSDQQAAALQGQTYLGLLLRAGGDPEVLRTLRRVAQLFLAPQFSAAIQFAAKTIVDLASTNLARNHGEKSFEGATTALFDSLRRP